MSNYRYNALIYSITAAIILCGTMSLVHSQNNFGAPTPQSPFGNGISPEKAQQFQKEMAEFQNEFESLSPQEQDSFYKSMDDAVQKIEELSKTSEGKELLDKLEKGTITDDELDGLINQLVEEEVTEKKEDVKKEAKKEKKPEPPKQVLTSKHEKAIDAINSLIAHTNSFIVKAATIPEMPSKVKRWSKKKDIKIELDQTWNSLKADIERLVEQLNKVLERDQKTKEYYHIDELLKKEALLNNILKVQKNVVKLEPTVQEMPLLSVQKMEKKVKKAYQDIINEYHEALYVLQITAELKDLFTLFDPKAKKYRETEEKAVQEAERLGKRPATPAHPVAGGSRVPAPSYGPARSAAPGVQRYVAPQQAYIPPSPGNFGTVSRPVSKPALPAEKAKSQKPVARKSGDLSGAEKDPKKEKPLKVDTQLEKDVDFALSKIESKLKEASDLIVENKLIKALDGVLIDTSPVDVSLAVEIIPDLNKALNMQKGLLGDVHQLHRKLKSDFSRKAVQDKMRKVYDKNKKDLDQFHKKLDDLQSNWASNQSSVPADKKYAFFGMTNVEVSAPQDEILTPERAAEIEAKKKQLEQTKMKVLAPYSLFEIKEVLSKIKAAIDNFSKTQLIQEKRRKKK